MKISDKKLPRRIVSSMLVIALLWAITIVTLFAAGESEYKITTWMIVVAGAIYLLNRIKEKQPVLICAFVLLSMMIAVPVINELNPKDPSGGWNGFFIILFFLCITALYAAVEFVSILVKRVREAHRK